VKTLTRQQVESRKEKAARFVYDVLDDPERAAEIEDESLEDYAERRKIQIAGNPRGGSMARIRIFNPRTVSNPRERVKQANSQAGRSELLARIRELQEENDDLQDTLDKVADLASAPEDGHEEEPDDLMDKLNDILDTVAPDEKENAGEKDDSGEE
jgi:HSP90 family molecular chaperone